MHVEIAAAMDRSSAGLLKRHYSHEMNRHDHPQSKRPGEVQSCTNALIRCTSLKIDHVRSTKYLLHEDEEEVTFRVDVQLLAEKHLNSLSTRFEVGHASPIHAQINPAPSRPLPE